MPKPSRSSRSGRLPADGEPAAPAQPRIVGGTLRGRKLAFLGDARTRPMKDRVREAVFNLLGPGVRGMHALDLFAGTGALAFEALSRGAAQATLVERHFPTAELLRRTAQELGVAERCHVAAADSLIWVQRDLPPPGPAWLSFVSPPWSLFHEQAEGMDRLIRILVERGPPGSMVVVEADEPFDLARLPQIELWEVRPYLPAVVAIWRS